MAQPTHPPHLLLHKLIISMSYWGSAVRVMLFGFVFILAQLLAATSGDMTLAAYALQTIYMVAALALLDTGYVTIVRATTPKHTALDSWLLLGGFTILGILLIAPYFLQLPSMLILDTKWLLLVVLFFVGLRLLIGVVFGRRAGK